MGIKNLHHFLRKTCPSVYSTVPISKYAFKKIAIDISIFMCKFKSSNGNNYIDSFLHLISVLRYNEVHFIFVYDTKAPPEKDLERKQRIEAREKNKVRVERIMETWFNYKQDLNLTEDSILEQNNLVIEDEVLLGFITKLMDNMDKISVKKIDNEIHKLQNSILSIRTEDFNLTKEFFKTCNIPFIDAEGEAEATCASLVRHGLVAAVLTEDTDVLAYKAPFMLHKLDISNGTMVEIDFEEILTQLKFTEQQFLDFCIMCGTDYNTNIFKIGPDKSYKLLQQYGSIEGIAEANPNISVDILNYEKTRSLFTNKLDLTVQVPYCGFPNKVEFEKLYFFNNCKFDLEKLYSSFHFSIFHDFEFKQNEPEKKKNLLLSCK
jgi:5'-3' exonuclease